MSAHHSHSLAAKIALRYLFSPKSHGAVNVISAVSVAGIAVATAAIVIVMSVFNGFADLAVSKLSKVDAPLTLVPAHGKVIPHADSLAAVISSITEVAAAMPVLDEKGLAMVGENQTVATLRGIPEGYLATSGLDGVVIDGVDYVGDTLGLRCAIVSVGVALSTGARPGSSPSLRVFVPRRLGRVNPASPWTAFRSDTLFTAGVYQTEQTEFDADMLMMPLPALRRMLDYSSSEASSIGIWAVPGISPSRLSTLISPHLPSDVRALTLLELRQVSFRMIAVEKWVTFSMLVFILLIASFNIISTMSMLIIEKKDNARLLRSMGATSRFVRYVFVTESRLICLAGGIAGMLLGTILVLAQQWGGFIRLSASDPSLLSIDTYPVRFRPLDLLAVAATIVVVTLITSAITARLTRSSR